MFTLKFYSHFDGDECLSESISCPRYKKYQYSDGNTEVTVFAKLSGGEEISFLIGERPDWEGYHVCYVENQSGKTIDVFRRPIPQQ